MREILFRGKKFEKGEIGEWVEGYYIRKQDPFIKDLDYHYIAKQNKDRHGILLEVTDWYRVYPETVGQYTGLKDKNGIKIFEGDIVKIIDSPFGYSKIGVVCFHKGKFAVKYKLFGKDAFNPFDEKYELKDMGATITITYTYEVIGNIYDNPELLGVENDG